MSQEFSSQDPPSIELPNIFPISWKTESPEFVELYEKARKEYWNPAELPWQELDPEAFSRQQRVAISYWFSILANFDASGPAAFARAMLHAYEWHQEDPLRKCLFTITRDEVNHEEYCQRALAKLLPGAPLDWQPQSELEELALRNIKWVYYNGSRYWRGYLGAYSKYSLPVLFTSFFMGELAATTLFSHMSKEARHPLFQQGFRNVARDEARHTAITLQMLRKGFPKLQAEEKPLITKQIRAGFIFLSLILYEAPAEFWQLPKDFRKTHRRLENIAREGGLGVATLAAKRKAWRDAMLKVKAVVEPHGVEFPAMPEVGITGQEMAELSEDEAVITVF